MPLVDIGGSTGGEPGVAAIPNVALVLRTDERTQQTFLGRSLAGVLAHRVDMRSANGKHPVPRGPKF